MSKPATAYFCGNGHLLESNGRGEWGIYDQELEGWTCPQCGCHNYGLGSCCGEGCTFVKNSMKCSSCGNSEIISILNWQDPEYCERCYNEGNRGRLCEHSHQPREIRKDLVEAKDSCDPPCVYHILIKVYSLPE